MGHHHHHHHRGHPHAQTRAGSKRALRWVLGLTAGFMVAEVVGGLLTGSLALLADAAHMLSDAGSVALALFAIGLAERPTTPKRSFGFQRAEILAALANGVMLVLLPIWIFAEAYERLFEPREVLGGPMLGVAAAGLLVNLVAAGLLMRDGGDSLNVSAALRHVVADLAGSVGAIVAAVVIIVTGWPYADPLVSVLIGLLVLASALPILRESLRVLLEAAPAGIDPVEVGRRMAAAEGVREVHDLHVWTITSGFPALSAHVLVGSKEDCHARRWQLERLLAEEFHIEHTTLQVEHEADHRLLTLEEPRPRSAPLDTRPRD
jgi:cobalt-zinc-cadmium efflux system protein